MSCKEISADWAAQRIKGLSLGTTISNALLPRKPAADRRQTIKTLIDHFRYPRKGPGMMWEACAAKTEELGGKLVMGARVTGCTWHRAAGTWDVTYLDGQGLSQTLQAREVISSAAIRDLLPGLRPAVSDAALHAARSLRYRDFLTVSVMAKDQGIFGDNWIYIHDPNVRVGRIQNFKSWSPEMVPDASSCCCGLEYFCFDGDSLWNSPDRELIQLAKRELEYLKLMRAGDVVDACVVRQPKAYPVYDDDYAGHVRTIREEIEKCFPTFHMVGRNGMHMYNNQDHAMMTAMLTAQNILAGRRVYDVWNVNQDAEYHESGTAGSQRAPAVYALPERAQPRRKIA
jgi:protoporphyrinogen oxidase